MTPIQTGAQAKFPSDPMLLRLCFHSACPNSDTETPFSDLFEQISKQVRIRSSVNFNGFHLKIPAKAVTTVNVKARTDTLQARKKPPIIYHKINVPRTYSGNLKNFNTEMNRTFGPQFGEHVSQRVRDKS